MPLVVGELVAGLLLGPSLLGKYFPMLNEIIFTSKGNVGLVLNGITTLSVVMLLFAAGMEVEFSLIRQQSKTALKTSITGLVVTLSMGYLSALYLFDYFGEPETSNTLMFRLFIATAMAITALPVIARTLMDLDLFKTRIGMVIIAAAMFDDVVGWMFFSVVLSLMHTGVTSYGFLFTLGYTILFAILILSVGRILINKSLPWAEKHLSWPGGVLSISLGLAFLAAAITEKIGLHAIFGAFIVGIAFGDSVHLNEKTRDIIRQFITNIFAPLFFVSIGFKVDFVANFNLQVTVLITALAIVTKIAGAGLGALWGGLTAKEALAVGFGMNARGAMEIVLGLLAMQSGLITEQLFVALVVMAVLTSILAGPMLKYLITGEMKVVNLRDVIKPIEKQPSE